METWGVVFLGIIAFVSLIQGAVLVGIAIFLLRLSRRLDALDDRLDREVGPALEGMRHVSRNLAEISDLATIQARRLDLVLGDSIDRVQETLNVLQRFVTRPMRPIANILAIFRGLQTGLDVFLQLGKENRSSKPSTPRSGEDDEHLFI
jgi:hypothetical protein